MTPAAPFDLSPQAIRNAHERVSLGQRKRRTGKVPTMEKWSRESRYWALRPTLFTTASELELQAILRHQKENGARNFDPNDVDEARTRAADVAETARVREIDPSVLILDRYNYWLHFPEVLSEVLGLDVDDLQRQVAEFDRQLVEAVVELDGKVRKEHEDRKRAIAAARQEQEERESRMNVLLKDPPCPYRMEAELLRGRRLKLRLALTDEDLRGHPQLMHPILTGLWDLFEPHAIRNSLFVDHKDGVFEVTTDDITRIDAFLEDFSSNIEAILDLDRRMVGPLSLTKSAELLGISRRGLEELVSVGEINPISIVTLMTGNLAGVQFLAFAAQDVLDLKAVLDDVYQPGPAR